MSLEQLEEILNSGKIKEKDLEIVKTRYGYYNDNNHYLCRRLLIFLDIVVSKQ